VTADVDAVTTHRHGVVIVRTCVCHVTQATINLMMVKTAVSNVRRDVPQSLYNLYHSSYQQSRTSWNAFCLPFRGTQQL